MKMRVKDKDFVKKKCPLDKLFVASVPITIREAKAILFWLCGDAKKRWVSGSNSIVIESFYNRMNALLKYPQTPKRWKWKSEQEKHRQRVLCG